MEKRTVTPDTAITPRSVTPELPKNRNDTAEIKAVYLSPEDQQLAYLPEILAEIIFAKLAEKNISA